MTAQIEAQAPDVDAERLNRPLGARYVEKHSHNQYAGISRANLVHLMNRLFGPHGWRNEIVRTEVLRDEVLPPAPGGDERLARYVSATAVVRVTARTSHGEIIREGMGIASQARMLDDRPKGPGTHGSDALQMAVLGAATSGLKHACYLIGRSFGGALGELGYRELAALGAEAGEPDTAPAATATFDGQLHERQSSGVKRLAKWYAAQVRKAPDRQAAEAAAQGAQEKLIEAGAERAAAEQVVASLAEAVAKKAPGTSPRRARNAR